MQRGGERWIGAWVAWLLGALVLIGAVPAAAFHYAWDQGHDVFNPAPPNDPPPPPENPNQCRAGNPVDLRTGQDMDAGTAHDIVIPGIGPQLALKFTYYSGDSYSGPFGRGWHTTLTETALATTDGVSVSVMCRQGGGERVRFSRGADGSLQRPKGWFLTAQVGTDRSVTITDKYGTVKRFNGNGALASITDRNGNRLSIEYAGGVISRAVGASERALTFVRGADGRIAQVVDPAGHSYGFTYSDRGELVATTDPLGHVTRYAYDDAQRLVSITDRRGNVKVRNTFDAQGRVVRQDFPDGTNFQFDYRNDGSIRTTNERGKTTTYVLNTTGQASTVTDPLGRVTRQETNADSQPTRVIDPRGVETRYEYDANGNLARLTEAFGRAEQRETVRQYESRFGQLVRAVDPDGHVTTIARDSRGNPTLITDALGGTIVLEYDSRGLVTAMNNQRGNRTTYAYNAAGDVSSMTDAEGNSSTFAHDAAGNVVGITRASGVAEERTTTFAYDPLYRRTSMTEAAGATTATTYDAEGNLVSTTDPTGIVVARTYDGRNRLVTVNDPASGQTTLAFDGAGNLVRSTDALGAATTLTYDDANQVSRVTDALGAATRYAYDPAGNLISVTDARGHETTSAFDALNRRISRINPLGNAYSYSYDRRGNVVQVIDAKGQMLSYVYDPLGRLTRVAAPDDEVSYSYDAGSNLLTAVDADSALSFAYNSTGRLVTARTEAGGVQPLVTLSQTWDAAGNRRQLDDGLGGVTLYDYDANDRLSRIRMPAGHEIGMNYDASGRLLQIAYPNGVEARSTFDAAGRLASLIHRGGPGNLESFFYSYSAVGSIEQIIDGRTTRSFVYDRAQQLVHDSLDGGASYVYDAVGNRTSSPRSSTYLFDAANRLLEDDNACYTYDANGNRTSKTEKVGDACSGPVTTYQWDAQNKLIAAHLTSGTTLTFRYDAIGRRIEKDNGGQSARYVYSGTDIVLEYDASGSVRAKYTHGAGIDQPIGITVDGSALFYHADHLGTIRALSDSTGLHAAKYEFDSFGRPQGPLAGPYSRYLFTGRELDNETGFYYYRARYYDPDTASFLSEDPLSFSLQDLHAYKYVFNNPLRYRDPYGLQALPGVLIGFGADASIPEPSDLAWPKWAGWGIVIIGAIIYDTVTTQPHDQVAHQDRTQEDAEVRQREYERAKRHCDMPPPEGGNECSTLSRLIDHAKKCIDLYEAWDAKWLPGRHSEKIVGWRNRLQNLKDEHNRRCVQQCR